MEQAYRTPRRPPTATTPPPVRTLKHGGETEESKQATADWLASKPQGTKNEVIKSYGELPFKAYSFGCGFAVATCLWSILMICFGGS